MTVDDIAWPAAGWSRRRLPAGAPIPILLAYPFVQRHFVKGMLIGAIKG